MRYGIDIFSGAGGLSLGAEMAGIKISTAIEINPHAAKTFLQNHKGAKVLQGDIQEIEPQTCHYGWATLSRILIIQYKDEKYGQQEELPFSGVCPFCERVETRMVCIGECLGNNKYQRR